MRVDHHNYAPFWTRLLAHNIDLTLFLIVAYAMTHVIKNDMWFYSTLIGLYVAYNTILELTDWQGSLGKKLLGIKVTSSTGQERSLLRSLYRNLLKFLSLGLLFGGFVMIRFNMKRQGLHDWLSGSVVIFR